MLPRPGEIFPPHYEILDELGRGGLGVVYRGLDRAMGRKVAIKLLLRGDPKSLRREAMATAQLDHPNIVVIHHMDEWRGKPFFVMERLFGQTCAQKLTKEGPLEVSAVLSIAKQALSALEHAHQRGVLHRDLTPGNLFLRNDGQLKLLDFGLAELSLEREALLEASRASSRGLSQQIGSSELSSGTLAYLSPEQQRGEPQSPRTDLWALSFVLYELLTGKRPFAPFMAQFSETPLVSPRTHRGEIPFLLDSALRKGLRLNPEKRWSSARKMRLALESVKPTSFRAAIRAGLGALGVGSWMAFDDEESLEAPDVLDMEAESAFDDPHPDDLGLGIEEVERAPFVRSPEESPTLDSLLEDEPILLEESEDFSLDEPGEWLEDEPQRSWGALDPLGFEEPEAFASLEDSDDGGMDEPDLNDFCDDDHWE